MMRVWWRLWLATCTSRLKMLTLSTIIAGEILFNPLPPPTLLPPPFTILKIAIIRARTPKNHPESEPSLRNKSACDDEPN